jgi:hypothetical protein
MASQPPLAAARYDPFAHQKLQALTKSAAAVGELAAAGEQLLADQAGGGGGRAATKQHLQEVFQVSPGGGRWRGRTHGVGPAGCRRRLFSRPCDRPGARLDRPSRMPYLPLPSKNQNDCQYALWGNKTDLSMLVDASKLDVNASVRGAAAGAGAGGNLIVDEFEPLWAAAFEGRPDGGWRGPVARPAAAAAHALAPAV